MRWSGSSYIGSGRQRQSPPFLRPVAIITLAATLGGCAGLGMPAPEFAREDKTLITGSIQKASAPAKRQVDQSDWEAVRSTIALAEPDLRSGAMDWQNRQTGSAGTITMLGATPAAQNASCRNFATTMNDVRGIRRYRGEACRMLNGDLQLFGILAEDSQLL